MDLLRRIYTRMKRLEGLSLMVLIGIALLGVALGSVACSSSAGRNAVKATWIKPQITGDTVSIPVSEIADKKIVHFNIPVALGGEIAFMAYEIDGKINVRANVCPPCRSIGFSLNKDTLVCDTCRTTFKANTGKGISGACVAYPKAAVSYEASGGKLLMRGSDLITAYQNTNEPGLP
ncbi:MAG: Fe-S-containing protein [Chloroflexota bacterium]